MEPSTENNHLHLNDPRERLILALDVPSGAAALAMLDRLEQSDSPDRSDSRDASASQSAELLWVKVGLELYLSAGAEIVRTLKARGYRVFLDLKLHDIPNTVAGAVRVLSALEPDLLTVHASGGGAMMAAAAAATGGSTTRLLAVTVLTSLDQPQLAAVGIADMPFEQVLRLARLAASAGIGGLVASAHEAAALRRELPGIELVTPGIRGVGDARGDQKRVMSATEALAAGASRLVVGRPILAAVDPRAALERIFGEIREFLQGHDRPEPSRASTIA